MVTSIAELEEKHTIRNLETVHQLRDVDIDFSVQHNVYHTLFGDSEKVESTLNGLASSGFSAKQTASDTVTVTTKVSLGSPELSSQCALIERNAMEFDFTYSEWTISAEAPELSGEAILTNIHKRRNIWDLPYIISFFFSIFRR